MGTFSGISSSVIGSGGGALRGGGPLRGGGARLAGAEGRCAYSRSAAASSFMLIGRVGLSPGCTRSGDEGGPVFHLTLTSSLRLTQCTGPPTHPSTSTPP